ncbi:MAG: AmmeMemoRadiSam system protein A [Propionibacteriaceae bacterium]|jgi:AmmeMemoRadiSam system protein A|nr:AmmeMemoRadiSam system protein A [Propionibacteriaceae bacterium]
MELPDTLAQSLTTPEAGQVLTALARTAIASELNLKTPEPPLGVPWLEQPGAAFVTLTISDEQGDHALRGSSGSLVAHRALGEDVQANARAAAFRDPRFIPLTVEELSRIAIEVSVLTPPKELVFTSQEDALAQLRPGVDGVIFQAKGAQATFLPQMWEELPHPVEFMQLLRRKARVRFDYWGPDVKLFTYQVVVFSEPAPPPRQSADA